eukprot:TRINITY_DN5018_c0_g1_i1.p1 TRINITY_DN5018_c0_g1~~TRINITY_DN5018_c0_g1_i1.p1  ORF type:complete len:221 (-),score=29.11 TRINITY_DN5018_c0_g1_i1:67-729(-)
MVEVKADPADSILKKRSDGTVSSPRSIKMFIGQMKKRSIKRKSDSLVKMPIQYGSEESVHLLSPSMPSTTRFRTFHSKSSKRISVLRNSMAIQDAADIFDQIKTMHAQTLKSISIPSPTVTLREGSSEEICLLGDYPDQQADTWRSENAPNIHQSIHEDVVINVINELQEEKNHKAIALKDVEWQDSRLGTSGYAKEQMRVEDEDQFILTLASSERTSID